MTKQEYEATILWLKLQIATGGTKVDDVAVPLQELIDILHWFVLMGRP